MSTPEVVEGHHGSQLIYPKDPFVCPKKGIGPPTFLFWGRDWNPQSYSREGSGSLGINNNKILYIYNSQMLPAWNIVCTYMNGLKFGVNLGKYSSPMESACGRDAKKNILIKAFIKALRMNSLDVSIGCKQFQYTAGVGGVYAEYSSRLR